MSKCIPCGKSFVGEPSSDEFKEDYQKHLADSPECRKWHKANTGERILNVWRTMNKSDLKTGMRVQYRNGSMRIVVLDSPKGDIFWQGDDYGELPYYKDDLRHQGLSDFDIVKIFDPPVDLAELFNSHKRGDLLWQRDDSKMIEIKGKLWSEDTIQEALKNYATR